jgi:hypothetical protein
MDKGIRVLEEITAGRITEDLVHCPGIVFVGKNWWRFWHAMPMENRKERGWRCNERDRNA